MTGTTTDFVAYEYTTIRVPRTMDSVYQDSYRAFGWIVEGYDSTIPHTGWMTLKLKRDRRIKNRPLVLELQRKTETALTAIALLERSKSSAAIGAALGIGIAGSAFLAGSVFALEAGLLALSIPLGVIGLVGWLGGYLVHGRVQASRTLSVNPLIDEQYDIVYDGAEQASRLLA